MIDGNKFCLFVKYTSIWLNMFIKDKRYEKLLKVHNNTTTKPTPLMDKISKTNTLIDELYGLTEDENKIAEGLK